MRAQAGKTITSADLDTLRHRTFYGREKDDTVSHRARESRAARDRRAAHHARRHAGGG